MTGPQVLMPGGGSRGADGQTDLVARGPGQIPDYVTGTDSLRARVVLAPEPEQSSEVEPDRADVVVFVSHDTLDSPQAAVPPHDEPLPTASYPSERGGVAYEANRPLPPAPPEDDEWIEVESGRG